MTARRVANNFDHPSSIIEVVIPFQLAVEPPRHAPVVPRELPDGIQFVYVDDRGRQRAIALHDAGKVDSGRTRPFREPPAYRRQRNFPGWWWSVTTRSHVVYESWLERHHIIEADSDLEKQLVSFLAQPRPLAQAASQVGDSIRVLPLVFHLLWLGRLAGDLSRPLGNGTILTADADPLEAI
jgi:hypothetical protein